VARVLARNLKRRGPDVGLKGRLKRLEEVRKREEAELSREALTHLSDEDLYALADVLEAGQEDGSATFEDLYRVTSEQSRRALDAYLDAFEAIREGREPPSSAEVGEEEMRQTRNGYRIWKYRK
jgi:hypothetical protein